MVEVLDVLARSYLVSLFVAACIWATWVWWRSFGHW